MQLFTSESVTEGHPDKVADSISDAILDAMLADDPQSHAAIETLVANGVVVVTGEAETEAYVDVQSVVRERILAIGFDSARKGLDGGSCGVLVALNAQSPDIAQSVRGALESRTGEALDDYDIQGAGDQGMMFGYACDETPELMPLPIRVAHRMAERLTEVRRDGTIGYLRPDGKTQITVRYDGDRPVGVNTVVVSAQHDDDTDLADTLTPDITRHVIRPILDEYGFDGDDARLLINPSGRFVIGGPAGDAGLTGRKIIVDTYGGMARHGGGAFSGKDPSKVDRSAAYATRWVAKNIVAAGLARRCEVQVSYAIGKARPTSLYVNTFGTGTCADSDLVAAISSVFDLRPAAIVDQLGLKAPIYSPFVAYGHFGREIPGASWEVTNKVEDLQRAVRG